ncbi:hypothetical protein OIU76_028266 [Salix suchowensis]|nr:hypothetical protein OIU76_028266 [Salix suchowensis]
MFLNIRYQNDIFLRSPRSFLHSYLITARWSAHPHFIYFFLSKPASLQDFSQASKQASQLAILVQR